jgi:hypothetical protein
MAKRAIALIIEFPNVIVTIVQVKLITQFRKTRAGAVAMKVAIHAYDDVNG